MKTSFLLALFTIGVSNAFHVIQRKVPIKKNLAMTSDQDGHDIVPATSAFRDIDVDMDRVKDCAEHFGKCSVQEIKELKKGTKRMMFCWSDGCSVFAKDFSHDTSGFQISMTNASRM